MELLNIEEDPETVLEKTAEDVSPPGSYTPVAMALQNMHANVDLLTSAVHTSLGMVPLDSPLAYHTPLSTKRYAKSKKTFTLH